MIQFIIENGLSPFNINKTSIRGNSGSLYKTNDAKVVHGKVISDIARHFQFPDTSSLLGFFDFTQELDILNKRQMYFSSLKRNEREFLKEIKAPRPSWKPSYSIIVVTEDEQTFLRLREMGCPCKLLISEGDVMELQVYDVVQVLNCEQYTMALEQLAQAVFLKNENEVYLERYVSQISGWNKIIELMKEKELSEAILSTINKIIPLMELVNIGKKEVLDRRNVENACEKMNAELEEKMKNLTISGAVLMNALSRGTLPDELKRIVQQLIKNSGFSEDIFVEKVPIEIDENELEKKIRIQSIEGFTSEAGKIKKYSAELLQVPKLLNEIERELLVFDFESGIAKWIGENKQVITITDDITMENAQNMFLENAQPIGFELNSNHRCSILTGANSGGKTTLLEHIIQNISLMQIGLPINGKIKMPLFSEVYYFAKNKGSASKGAFETLLTQMSQIKTGNKTLILADEIESVTEPGVAGKIIAATADYFIKKNCFLVVATHLGQEIQKVLPERARIDGIEAKGLDENNELIVDHNPVLGRLAHSTPELIVEKMTKKSGEEYFVHLFESLKNKND